MEQAYSWLIIFSGATIVLLGTFLFAAERELGNKRREFDEFRREQAARPVKPSTEGEPADAHSGAELIAKNTELETERAALSTRLGESEKALAKLQNLQFENRQLQDTTDNLKNQLEISESRLMESAGRVQEAVELNAALQSEITRLKQQLTESETAIETLQSAARHAAKAQSENQELGLENRRLQEEIAKLGHQLESNEERLNATAGQHEEIAERHAQLQTDFAESMRQSDVLTAKNKELLDALDAVSNKLAASEKNVEEFRATQNEERSENQQRQRENDDLNEQLERTRVQLGESTERAQAAAAQNEKLQLETGELKQQLEQRQAAIEELQKATMRLSEIQPELQTVRLENQRLQGELEEQRVQLHSTETRLQESTRKNQEASDRCEHLEAEVGDYKRQLEDSHSKVREIDAAQQRLANVESRETIYREQQEKLEALIVDLERELSEGKNQVQALDETHQRLRETERVCEELAEENRRLGEEVSVWQERLAASEENQRQVNLLRQQLDELRNEHARVLDGNRRAQDKLTGEPMAASHLTAGAGGATIMQSTANTNDHTDERIPTEIAISETKSPDNGLVETLGDPMHFGSGDTAAGIPAANEKEASSLVWASVKQKWRVGAVAATLVVIAGTVAMVFLETTSSTSEESAVARETRTEEYTAAPAAKPRVKATPGLQGTFETIRPTTVYGGPSENAELIASIGAGVKLNVVDSSDGWLEIRSKHGRPPGYIRQGAAVRIGQN